MAGVPSLPEIKKVNVSTTRISGLPMKAILSRNEAAHFRCYKKMAVAR
jgi:hypothetical protein